MGVRRPFPPVLANATLQKAPAINASPIRRAVVTGPTGTLGVHLISALAAGGTAVYAVCRPDSPRFSNIPVHPLVTPVPCALDALDTLPKRIGVFCDAFFHLAWAGPYGAARENKELQRQNVADTCGAVRAAYALGCKTFTGAGSQSEFGPVNGVLSPALPCRPDTEYGRAKLLAGQRSRAMCETLGIRHNWCRILSLYGPFDADYTMVMSVIRALFNGERPACTAGDQLWDYLYASDAARAFTLVAERGAPGAVYCLGSGKSRPLRDYICAIRDAVDPSLPIGFGERPYYPHQIMHLEADLSALAADVGFAPRYAFEDGIRETVAWARERKPLL